MFRKPTVDIFLATVYVYTQYMFCASIILPYSINSIFVSADFSSFWPIEEVLLSSCNMILLVHFISLYDSLLDYRIEFGFLRILSDSDISDISLVIFLPFKYRSFIDGISPLLKANFILLSR